ncbi:TfoX/Sxy family DNA transformation protein [uncultured Jannaschia sp.]|uniref:TfoX/Sxy family DNA transformation protein n=1 Tax=uncultured Jannaschia sp. TaxID=293347 RepID=UPI0026325A67|nr:TfoX/Sxy family DNA transformation protein [uncultured Jannaschia sp.]
MNDANDDAPVSALRNLGPKSEATFARAGITTVGQLRAMGADAAYAALIAAGTPPHFIGFYALEMGLQGRPWNDAQGDEKVALRARFDAIVSRRPASRDTDRDAFEAAMDALGIIDPDT